MIILKLTPNDLLVIALNSSSDKVTIEIEIPFEGAAYLEDLLNPGQGFPVQDGRAWIELWPNWATIMMVKAF